MDIERIVELMAEPEKLNDSSQINVLSSYVGGFVTELEETLNEENYQVSLKWLDLRKELKSNAEADRAIELTDIYREREKNKILLARLKRFRGDLRDRFQVVSILKRY